MPQIGGKPKADTGKKRGRPPRKKEDEVVEKSLEEDVKGKHIDGNRGCCLCCGTQNNRLLYKSYNRFNKIYGYIPYCKECLRGEIWEYFMIKFSKNEQLALHSLLRSINVPYIHSIYQGAIKHLENPNSNLNTTETDAEDDNKNALVSAYLKNYNSFHDKNGYGDTYIDSDGLSEIQGLSSLEETIKIQRKRKKERRDEVDTDKYDIIDYDVDDLILKWGCLDDEDLIFLENQYLDWKEKIGDFIEEKTTEILIVNICHETLGIRKKRELGENVDKETKTLLNLMNNSNLLEKQQTAMKKQSLGMTIRDLEEYAPIRPVDCALDDVDGYKNMILSISGCLFKAQGVENEYTEAFDEIFKDYELDVVKNLVRQNMGESVDKTTSDDDSCENDEVEKDNEDD